MSYEYWSINHLPVDTDCISYMKKLYLMDQFCYECQHYLPFKEVQEKPCSICQGQKCFRLHGGELYQCDNCAFIDCYAFQRCCIN